MHDDAENGAVFHLPIRCVRLLFCPIVLCYSILPHTIRTVVAPTPLRIFRTLYDIVCASIGKMIWDAMFQPCIAMLFLCSSEMVQGLIGGGLKLMIARSSMGTWGCWIKMWAGFHLLQLLICFIGWQLAHFPFGKTWSSTPCWDWSRRANETLWTFLELSCAKIVVVRISFHEGATVRPGNLRMTLQKIGRSCQAMPFRLTLGWILAATHNEAGMLWQETQRRMGHCSRDRWDSLPVLSSWGGTWGSACSWPTLQPFNLPQYNPVGYMVGGCCDSCLTCYKRQAAVPMTVNL